MNRDPDYARGVGAPDRPVRVAGVHAPDALAVSCDECNVASGHSCITACEDSPTGARTRAPHPSRVAKARAALAKGSLDDLPTVAEIYGSAERRENKLAIELILGRASDADLLAILAVVRVRQALPAGIDELVAVFKHGAVKYNGGALGVADGVTADDCAEHLLEHAHRVHGFGASTVDSETGRLDAAHAAARGVMVCQLAKGGR